MSSSTQRTQDATKSPTAPSPRPWKLLVFLDTAPDKGTMVSSSFATKDEAKAQLAEVVRSSNSSEGSIYATLADDGMSSDVYLLERAERIRKFWVQYRSDEEEAREEEDEDKKPSRLRLGGHSIGRLQNDDQERLVDAE